MARIVCDEIKFEALSKELQDALNLLLKHRKKALRYWTSGNHRSCPLQEAYGLSLVFRTWKQIKNGEKGYPYESPDISPDPKTIEKLKKLGWMPKTYNSFMEWFEADDLPQNYAGESLKIAERNNRINFLKSFLSGA